MFSKNFAFETSRAFSAQRLSYAAFWSIVGYKMDFLIYVHASSPSFQNTPERSPREWDFQWEWEPHGNGNESELILGFGKEWETA